MNLKQKISTMDRSTQLPLKRKTYSNGSDVAVKGKDHSADSGRLEVTNICETIKGHPTPRFIDFSRGFYDACRCHEYYARFPCCISMLPRFPSFKNFLW